jgi:hypothetical protein
MNGGMRAGPETRASPYHIRSPRYYDVVRNPDVAEMTGAGRECTVSMISELSIPCR